MSSEHLLAEGDYYGTVLAGWDITKTTQGKIQLVFPVRLTHKLDDETGEWKELPKPARRDVSLFFSREKIKDALRDLRFLGYDRNDASGLNPVSKEAFDFKGRVIGAKVQHKEWKEVVREAVWFSKRGVEQSKESRQETLNDLQDFFGGAGGDEDGGEDSPEGFPFGPNEQ